MKTGVAVSVILVTGLLFCRQAGAQATAPVPSPGASFLASTNSRAVVRGLRKRAAGALSDTNATAQLRTAPPKALPVVPNVFAADGLLQPGLYDSAPCTGTVMVPRAHPDDKCIIGFPGTRDQMPIKRPELQLTPHGPGVYFTPRDPR